MLSIVAFIIHTWRPHATIQEQDSEGYFLHPDPLTLDCCWEFHNKHWTKKTWYDYCEMYSGCAESYLLPNRKIHDREKKKQRERDRQTDPEEERRKNRELSLMSFLVSFCDLALSFCWTVVCKKCFRVSIFFFFDGVLTLACHENSETVVLKLHFLSLRSLFVFSVWICLRFMVFFGSREGKRRECGYIAAM